MAPVTLMGLASHHCRWPVWGNRQNPKRDPKAKPEIALFCGAPKAGVSSYCAVHADAARDTYQPASRRIEKPVDYGTRKAVPEPVEPDAFDVLRDDAEEIAAEPHVRVHAREGWAAGPVA